MIARSNALLRNRAYVTPSGMKECECHLPRVAKARAREMAEKVRPKTPEGVDPIVLAGGPGSKCRPFLVIQKDAERFAACNALSDEIGPLDTPKKAARVVMDAIGDEVNEVFGLVTLDLHKRMKSVAETGRGEPTSVMAPIVPTLQAALMDGAHAVILFHCHPSGIEARPSDADIETTEMFAEVFDTLNECGVEMCLLDHIIVGGDIRNRSFYSFLEDGRL